MASKKNLKLGYNTGYWGSGPPAGALEGIKEAERLGFDSVWTAEAYGSDALTPLAWWGAHTERVRLGTGIIQMSARTPAATAMAAMTIDHLSNGRFILGLGASGPQVVEGWYGQPYPKPLARTREYISIVREIIRREAPINHHGEFYDMPYPGGAGLGTDFADARCIAADIADEKIRLREGDLQRARRQAFRRLRNCSSIAEPSSAGDLTVRTPAASKARNLSAAVPLPPAMTAPA